MEILKNYAPAIRFVAIFVGLYLLLNTAYSLFIDAYAPNPDPMTTIVTSQVAGILSVFHGDVVSRVVESYASIPLELDGKKVVDVFEGCNGINVFIVYVVFIVAFTGPLKLTLRYFLVGAVLIYLMNLVRVAALFEVALYFPERLYFFHKFLFTGTIYIAVFGLWYLWIRQLRKGNA